jgi:DNA-damage-inducible protein D
MEITMTISPPDFESVKQTNIYGVEYWSARDLAPLLGYRKWERFEDTIQRAMISCEQVGEIVQSHFPGAGKWVKVGSGAEREIKDYALSRLACYLIAQNGDPRKPEIAAAQHYFAISTRKLEIQEIHKLREEQEERLKLREQVAESNTALATAAQNAGVQSHHFGIFQNAGYLGMYTLDADGIREKKKIPDSGEILDYMGRQELAANEFRITQTEAKLKNENILGEEKAIHTHYQVGSEVRTAIERIGGIMPEDIPAEPSIKALLEERRKARIKRLKSEKQQKANDIEQKRLF